MKQITGLGGAFFKVKDPKALAAWYQDVLGIEFNGSTYAVLPLAGEDGKVTAGYNILAFFDSGNKYFDPSDKPVMLNLRVQDLFGLLEELKTKNITIVGDPIDEEYGKFGWILDPEGNKIELWEPPKE